MKFIHWNVNGIRAILKKDFENIFNNFNADIFSLNETKFSEDSHEKFIFEPAGYHVYWTNSKIKKGYSGVAIFTKIEPLSVHYGLKDGKYDEEGRVITLEFPNFYYIAAYVPNAQEELKRINFRLEYEHDLKEYIQELKTKKHVVYCGDLNVAATAIDLKNPKANEFNPGYSIEERTAFKELKEIGLTDTFRYLYPDTIKYSWWSYRFKAREKNIGWRIDYYLVNDEIKENIINAEIHNDVFGSDHCPIELDINL